jgi:formate hydrogenlyase subunit 3/multisubunit Na+/H+ antiporter MnhD subunit
MILVPLIVPAAAAIPCLACMRRPGRAPGLLLLAGALANAAAVAAALLATRADVPLAVAPGALGPALAFRLDALARPFLLASAVLGLVIAPFAARALPSRRHPALLAAAYLLTVVALQGAILAADVLSLLFFWEGMLVPLLVLVAAAGSARVALRAFATCAVADLALLAGLGIVEAQSGAGLLAGIHLAGGAAAALALALIVVGAAARTGAAPFHGWLPEAAAEAPHATAFLSGAGKIAGAYLFGRAAGALGPLEGPAAALLAVMGGASLVLGLLLAAAQGDPRRRAAHLGIAHAGLVLLCLLPRTPGAASVAAAVAFAGALAVAGALVRAGARPEAQDSTRPGPAWGRGLREAERALDPARLARAALDGAATVALAIDRLVNALYDVAAVGLARACAALSRRAHDGSHATYLVWALVGLAALVVYLAGGL